MRNSNQPIKWKKIPRVLVLGLDGLDYHLTSQWIAQGYLPNLAHLAHSGRFSPLATVNPAASPVAWSSLLTGCNPGKHGIFDFVHVNPFSLWVDLSTIRYSRKLATWESLRKVPTIGQHLTSLGYKVTSLFTPVTFPVPSDSGVILSGLETPDLKMGPGIFSLFTTDASLAQHVGSNATLVSPRQSSVDTAISLPGGKSIPLQFSISGSAVDILLGNRLEARLEEGQWSDWLAVDAGGTQAILCLYCRSISPDLTIYVSPVQYPPGHKLISSPPEFGEHLASRIGLYPTLGYPYDTDALSKGALDDYSYLEQVHSVMNRIHDAAIAAAEENDADVFMAFFLEGDAIQHMFWRVLSFTHPLHGQSKSFSNVILDTYRSLDALVGVFIGNLDETTKIYIVSDHGFQSFNKSFDVNRWLCNHGYLTIRSDWKGPMTGLFSFVDWSGTLAYSYGMGRISANLRGRERQGIVSPGFKMDRLLEEIIHGLESERDPDGKGMVVSRVWRTQEIYSGNYANQAPDLTIGFNPGYRADKYSVLGGISDSVTKQNNHPWSGDHASVAPQFVPGILFTNRPVSSSSARLIDVAPTIVKDLGLEQPECMDGSPLW